MITNFGYKKTCEVSKFLITIEGTETSLKIDIAKFSSKTESSFLSELVL